MSFSIYSSSLDKLLLILPDVAMQHFTYIHTIRIYCYIENSTLPNCEGIILLTDHDIEINMTGTTSSTNRNVEKDLMESFHRQIAKLNNFYKIREIICHLFLYSHGDKTRL
ncbi:hypothetical protein V1478_012578 [Vespula squamosa]|uniref:Uncharacterized protein n=1 Tax=Vespula squamosa TaxID=30214 RepID=A0ABD2AEE9_VESSQ